MNAKQWYQRRVAITAGDWRPNCQQKQRRHLSEDSFMNSDMLTSRAARRRLLVTVLFLFCYTVVNILLQKNEDELERQDPEQEQVSSLSDVVRLIPTPKKRDDGTASMDDGNIPGDQIIDETCSTDDLGLSDYARQMCINESTDVCRFFTCRNLLTGSGNDLFIGHAKLLMKTRQRKSLSDVSFVNVTSDCDQFKRERGYHLKPANREEEEFPIAFNILAHTNAEQVERLIRSIYRPHNVYCIHVDRKAPQVLRDALQSIASCFDNIQLATRSESIVYAGYSRLQADINCMQDNLRSKVRWRYLINTAGQAFPLRSVSEMVRILKIYNGANDIEGLYGHHIIKQRHEREWREVGNEVVQTGLAYPRPPHDIDIVRGSAYGVFSREFVQFVADDQRAIDFLKWSRKTFSPDEHYWATLHHTYSNPHLHTPGGYSGYPTNKTWLAVYANWDWKTCRGKLVHNVCVFGVGDLPALVQRKEFFANKFYEDFEPLALDCLEAWIRHKDNCRVPLQEEFYKNLPFIKKKNR